MKRSEVADLAQESLGDLYRYASRIAANPHEAEDLVQDAVERLLAHANRIPERAAVRPYLFRTAHNQFINRWRAKKRRPVLMPLESWSESDPPARVESRITRPDRIVRESLDDEVQSALDTLNDAWRETIWLRAVDGFTYEEIASITGVPIGTVRSRLARARRALAVKLLGYAERQGMIRDSHSEKGPQR